MIPLFLGLILGAGLFYLIFRFKRGSFIHLADEILHRAELEAQKREARADLTCRELEFEQLKKIEREEEKRIGKLEREKERLQKSEERLEARHHEIEKKGSELELKSKQLEQALERAQKEKREAQERQESLKATLEGLSGMSREQARELLLERTEKQLESEFGQLLMKHKQAFEERSETEARKILATALGRLALPSACEQTLTTIALPTEEMKGRIIGREGKNIRAFEEKAGVNLVVDEAPKTLIVSCFDPVRKAVAESALLELIQDGRIHPSRIEEAIESAKKRIESRIRQEGERAVFELAIPSPHKELVLLLGKLQFRQTLGQNILSHSIEVAHLTGLMAAELGLEGSLARRIGLLHDIGKAVNHESTKSHAIVGQELALKFGEKPEVANGIGAHHGEIAPTTLEAALASAANAISASRLGARLESFEPYIRRLARLEALAMRFQGVERAYALSAGKELRVIVEPEAISDEAMASLARHIAHAIAEEITFAGRIRITLIREKRATEYAT